MNEYHKIQFLKTVRSIYRKLREVDELFGGNSSFMEDEMDKLQMHFWYMCSNVPYDESEGFGWYDDAFYGFCSGLGSYRQPQQFIELMKQAKELSADSEVGNV